MGRMGCGIWRKTQGLRESPCPIRPPGGSIAATPYAPAPAPRRRAPPRVKEAPPEEMAPDETPLEAEETPPLRISRIDPPPLWHSLWHSLQLPLQRRRPTEARRESPPPPISWARRGDPSPRAVEALVGALIGALRGGARRAHWRARAGHVVKRQRTVRVVELPPRDLDREHEQRDRP